MHAMRTLHQLSIALLLVLAGISTLAHALSEDELLAPEVAFAMQAEAAAPDKVVVTFDIAPGYYMYRNAFAFSAEGEDYELGPPVIPDGKVKDDEFFGKVEIFRDRVAIELPLAALSEAPPRELTIKTTSQGCADVGVCYPPLYQTAALALPSAPESSAATAPEPAAGSGGNPLESLRDLGSGLGLPSDDEFLEPDQAFLLEPDLASPRRLELRWEIAPGYYLYRDKVKVALKEAQGARLGPLELPHGKEKHDEFFGDIEVYYDQLVVGVPLENVPPSAQTLTFEVTYQGCAEKGICYPPITKTVLADLGTDSARVADTAAPGAAGPATSAATGVTAEPDASMAAPAPTGELSEQDRLAKFLIEKPLWLSALLFFAVGIGLAFTPCVFPMIPILSGIIVGQGKDITTGKAFTLSLVYVLAMAVTYTVIGVLVGLSGESIQAWFQNPWVLSAFAAIFVLLALSMFGFYELQMPSAIQSRLTEISSSQRGGTLVGVGIMGFLSALIVGPCVTAPLIAVLIVIAQTGDGLMGGVALFALSMGMGVPLLAIGTGAGKLLPRAGAWMDATKAVFGVLLLGVGIWMLERILPLAVTMALWGVLLMVSAIYMRALEPVPDGASGWRRLWKGVGLVLLIYGALLLVGAASGGKDVLQPLKGMVVAGGAGTAEQHLTFKQIKGIAGLEQELEIARAQNRTVMLDFYADWCTSCKEMEKYTFTDPEVQQALANTIVLQTNVTANDPLDKALMKRFDIFGPPAILFFAPGGQEHNNYRLVGFVPATEFAAHVRRFVSGV
jgi:thiol:disulfide interchange protein DsbD